ncbi:hypothetical protein HanPSC8_Chr04g0136381 [Helianthus annuus]|nr:hypothetical protein HanPSC8_Chr04g0136381 [Helianthus annuus]
MARVSCKFIPKKFPTNEACCFKIAGEHANRSLGGLQASTTFESASTPSYEEATQHTRFSWTPVPSKADTFLLL